MLATLSHFIKADSELDMLAKACPASNFIQNRLHCASMDEAIALENVFELELMGFTFIEKSCISEPLTLLFIQKRYLL